MEYIKLVLEFIGTHGIVIFLSVVLAIIAVVLIFEKAAYLWRRWRSLLKQLPSNHNAAELSREKDLDLDRRITALESALKGHLEKEAIEDIRLGKMDVQLIALEDRVILENGHIFSQLKSIHEKIDKLFEVLLKR